MNKLYQHRVKFKLPLKGRPRMLFISFLQRNLTGRSWLSFSDKGRRLSIEFEATTENPQNEVLEALGAAEKALLENYPLWEIYCGGRLIQ